MIRHMYSFKANCSITCVRVGTPVMTHTHMLGVAASIANTAAKKTQAATMVKIDQNKKDISVRATKTQVM